VGTGDRFTSSEGYLKNHFEDEMMVMERGCEDLYCVFT
jgi:hypothetical protein